jgi:hypothetical protein
VDRPSGQAGLGAPDRGEFREAAGAVEKVTVGLKLTMLFQRSPPLSVSCQSIFVLLTLNRVIKPMRPKTSKVNASISSNPLDVTTARKAAM